MAMPAPHEPDRTVETEPEPVGAEPATRPQPVVTEVPRPVPEGPAPRRPVEVRNRPVGLGSIGIWAILFGAWAGIVPYVGPLFGYRANATGAWTWNLDHALLHLAPGVVAVAAGLVILGMLPRARRIARGRFGAASAGLVLVACGAWLVLGPSIWPIFYPSAVVFGHSTSALTGFVNRVGYNLGPGLVLVWLGAMAMKAGRRDRRTEVLVRDGERHAAAA